jgi:cytoskeleton protein RodZ
VTTGRTGAAWKAKREAMGKTLEQVAGELRVSRRYLAGIEEGDFRGWPERVFSSGFIRAYAKFLSEDPGPVLAEYERLIEEREESKSAEALRPEWLERERQRGTRRTTYTIAGGVVLLVGLVLSWVSFRSANRPLPPPPTIPAAPVASPGVDNAAGTADNAAVSAPVSDNASPGGAPTVAVASPEGEAPAATVSSVGGSGPLAGPFQLFLEASEQTWLMYSFDDGDPIDVMLYPGDKISIQAKRRIALKLGNAGGVAGTLNGSRLPPFGERGQVRKLEFGQ